MSSRSSQSGGSLPPYTIEFFEDEDGTEPALSFMRGLTPAKRRAIGVAITEVLAFEGPNVAAGNWGRSLGRGLYEFRLDQDAEQVLRRKGKKARPEKESVSILLRVFFHVHGDKVVLLLGGYDKGERPSKRHQQAEIDAARSLLKKWLLKQKAHRAAEQKAAQPTT